MGPKRPKGTIRALYRKRSSRAGPSTSASQEQPQNSQLPQPFHSDQADGTPLLHQSSSYRINMDTTVTPESLRMLQQQYAAALSASEGPTQPAVSRKKGWEAYIPSYDEIRTMLADLAERALKKGFRQPMNFHEGNDGSNEVDTWNRQTQLKRYTFAGVFAAADTDDPVQCTTHNEGLIKFELWDQAWTAMKEGYLKDAMLPDLRDVMLHEEVGMYLTPVLETEVKLLQSEMARVHVYTEAQIQMLKDGINDREAWLEETANCMAHMKTFQHIYTEFPDDAMLGKKWFNNFRD
ncbi:hypothetical protein ABW21_db0201325 [Orbilia brochopaga]|nr:hypothetical protein ABW21_db0201325 [Drechslerella brochopaga]